MAIRGSKSTVDKLSRSERATGRAAEGSSTRIAGNKTVTPAGTYSSSTVRGPSQIGGSSPTAGLGQGSPVIPAVTPAVTPVVPDGTPAETSVTTGGNQFKSDLSGLSGLVSQLLSGAEGRNQALASQRQDLNAQIQKINDPQYFQNALAQVMQGYQPLQESQQRQIGEQFDESGRKLDIDQARRGVFNSRFSADQAREQGVDRTNALADAMAQLQGQAVGDVRNMTAQQLQALGQIGSGIGTDLSASNQQSQVGLQGLGLQGDLATQGYQLPAQLGLQERGVDLQERGVDLQERLGESQLTTEGIKQETLGDQLGADLAGTELANTAAQLGIDATTLQNEYIPDFLANELTSQNQDIIAAGFDNILSEIDINYFKPQELKNLENAVKSGDLANVYQGLINSGLPAKQKAELDNTIASTYLKNTQSKVALADSDLRKVQWNSQKNTPNQTDLLKDMNTFSNIIDTQFTTTDPATGIKNIDKAGVTMLLNNMGDSILDGSLPETLVPMLEFYSAAYNVPLGERAVASGSSPYAGTPAPTDPLRTLTTGSDSINIPAGAEPQAPNFGERVLRNSIPFLGNQ